MAAHWEDIAYLNENDPKVSVSASLFVSNSKHPTCSGGLTTADLMLNYASRFVYWTRTCSIRCL